MKKFEKMGKIKECVIQTQAKTRNFASQKNCRNFKQG
jgi:hypothetical protein